MRVLLADGAELGALQAWAAAQRAELVPRHERPVEPFADACGLERVRAALHAHAWSNLRRKDTRFSVPPPPLDGSYSAPFRDPFTGTLIKVSYEINPLTVPYGQR